MKYTSTVCAPRVDNSQAHFSAQITHRWSDEWELEQITFAGDNSNTSSTGSTSGICTARSMYYEYTLSISIFCLFYTEREERFILREYILYALDFTQPDTKYRVATSTSCTFVYLRLRRKHWRIDRRVTSV